LFSREYYKLCFMLQLYVHLVQSFGNVVPVQYASPAMTGKSMKNADRANWVQEQYTSEGKELLFGQRDFLF